jgi:hypothetical protein
MWMRAVSPESARLQHLARSAVRRALRTKPSEYDLALAKNPLAKRSRSRRRHVAPFHVLNLATPVANKVVMPLAFRIESRGAAFGGHFTHQSRPHQVPQIVISRSPGGARIHAIHGVEYFRRRGMLIAFDQECHQSVTLRRAPQPAVSQGPLDRQSIHQRLRIFLMCDVVKTGALRVGYSRRQGSAPAGGGLGRSKQGTYTARARITIRNASRIDWS